MVLLGRRAMISTRPRKAFPDAGSRPGAFMRRTPPAQLTQLDNGARRSSRRSIIGLTPIAARQIETTRGNIMTPQEAKATADFLIADFENEMRTTANVLGAVPDDHLDYKPDEKSKTGLGLVRHITARGRVVPRLYRQWRVRSPARRLRCLRNHDAGGRGGPLQRESSGGGSSACAQCRANNWSASSTCSE